MKDNKRELIIIIGLYDLLVGSSNHEIDHFISQQASPYHQHPPGSLALVTNSLNSVLSPSIAFIVLTAESLRNLVLGTKTGELAINMLHNLVRNIIFDIPVAVPFIGNEHGRSTETDKIFILINPTYETKYSVSKRPI
jgi:hypothetical protein